MCDLALRRAGVHGQELQLLSYYAAQATFYYDVDDANITLAQAHLILK